ncbi:hypothetical protein ASF70_13010 [Rhizobium sp. Leaf321]|uniref:pentapeptide repeat-containing protein n=1 Tax=Rhizobium sp. Leaf321 TaxID=1736335 RepID=UPI00071587C3|nr:pentapeptide repeat-containing protein [Rhizobium sp. Leaf321]KQQ72444.1 hypothetical protein ASF70_13010 [Rhizobium sp. Leaf321]
MKDDLVLDGMLSLESSSAIERVIDSEATNFGGLIRLAGLNPKRHLRHADLRDIDLTDTDLSGYDFSGCDLRGAHGIRVAWSPETTVLDDALLEGSLFEHRMAVRKTLASDEGRLLHKQVRGYPWAEQVVWAMKNLRADAPDLARNRAVAAAVFDQTQDSFLKGEMLKYLEKSATGNDDQLYSFMLDIINHSSGDVHLIAKTIGILGKSRLRRDPRLHSAIEALLKSTDVRVVGVAIQASVITAPTKEDIRRVAEFALARREAPLRIAFIGTLMRRLGPAFDYVARNVFTKDYRDNGASVGNNEFLVLVRNIRRGFSDEQEGIKNGTRRGPGFFTKEFGRSIEENALIERLKSLFTTMADHGMRRITIAA